MWIQDHTLEQNFETPLSNKQYHLFPSTLTLWRGPFSEIPVLKVLLPDKWTLRGCLYENRNKLSHPHWPGDQKLFLLHGIFTGDASSIWNNVINAFYSKFWNQFGKFPKHSWFFAFGIWKNGGYTCLICYFLMINIYCFFDLLLFRWSWHMVTALEIFLLICSSVCDFWKVVFMLFCSSHLTYKKI